MSRQPSTELSTDLSAPQRTYPHLAGRNCAVLVLPDLDRQTFKTGEVV
jgi:hypothetical protein